jgi:diguanylate cyclase (GGDEF)-like protein
MSAKGSMDRERAHEITEWVPEVIGFWMLFEPRLEADFRSSYLRRSIGQLRFTLLMGALFYALFAALDVIIAPEALGVLWAIRFGVVIPALLIALSLTWRPWFPRRAEGIMLAACGLGGLGIIAMLPVVPAHVAQVYYAGLMLVFIMTYTWSRVSLRSATALGWFLVLLYEIVAILFLATPGWIVVSNNFFFISCNVLAMLACRSIERYAREEFLMARRLMAEEEVARRANEELARLAQVDGLTGIDNRRALDEALEQEWRRAKRRRNSLSIIIGDIDWFKDYNDALGHLAGDDCLRAVATALAERLLRPMDRIARYGGEEFVVLLPDTDIQGAETVAEALLQAVRELRLPHPALEDGGCVSMSFGVAALVPTPEQGAHQLLGLADSALYTAKRTGRDRYFVHADVSGEDLEQVGVKRARTVPTVISDAVFAGPTEPRLPRLE